MTTETKLIKAKLNLLELGAYLGNVSETCRTLGYSRVTFFIGPRRSSMKVESTPIASPSGAGQVI